MRWSIFWYILAFVHFAQYIYFWFDGTSVERSATAGIVIACGAMGHIYEDREKRQ